MQGDRGGFTVRTMRAMSKPVLSTAPSLPGSSFSFETPRVTGGWPEDAGGGEEEERHCHLDEESGHDGGLKRGRRG